MSNDVFGDFLTGKDVENAVESTMQTWLPTYLRAIERKYELDVEWLQLPKATVVTNEFAQFQDVPLPAVIIVCPGTEGKPEKDGDGYHAWWWTVAVAVIVEAYNDTAARTLAQYYAGALELLFAQKKSLGGFASTLRLDDVGHDEAPPDFARGGCGVASVGFAVFTERVVTDRGGPSSPSDDPAPWPRVETVHIDVERLTS